MSQIRNNEMQYSQQNQQILSNIKNPQQMAQQFKSNSGNTAKELLKEQQLQSQQQGNNNNQLNLKEAEQMQQQGQQILVQEDVLELKESVRIMKEQIKQLTGEKSTETSIIDQKLLDLTKIVFMHGEVLEAARQGLGIKISFQTHKESLQKLHKTMKSSSEAGNNALVEGDKSYGNGNKTNNHNTNLLANKSPTEFPEEPEFEHEWCNDLMRSLNDRDLTHQQDSGKVKLLENILLQMNLDLKDRMKRSEFVSTTEEVKDQLKLVNEKLALMVDKDAVKTIKSKVTILEQKMEESITKKQTDEKVALVIGKLKDEIKGIYCRSDQLQAARTVLLTAQQEYAQNLTANFDAMKQSTAALLDSFQTDLYLKADVSQVKEVSDFCQQLAKSDDLLPINQAIKDMNGQIDQIIDRQEAIQKFLERTDESLLFRATRMDLQVAVQNIQNNYTPLLLHHKLSEANKVAANNLAEQLKELLQISSKQILQDLQISSHRDIQDTLRLEVAKYFLRYDIHKMESILQNTQLILPNKAETAEVFQLRIDQRVSERQVSKLEDSFNKMVSLVKQMSINTSQYLRSISSDSIPLKQLDALNKSITSIDQLVETLNSINLHKNHKTSPSMARQITSINSSNMQDPPSFGQFYSQQPSPTMQNYPGISDNNSSNNENNRRSITPQRNDDLVKLPQIKSLNTSSGQIPLKDNNKNSNTKRSPPASASPLFYERKKRNNVSQMSSNKKNNTIQEQAQSQSPYRIVKGFSQKKVALFKINQSSVSISDDDVQQQQQQEQQAIDKLDFTLNRISDQQQKIISSQTKNARVLTAERVNGRRNQANNAFSRYNEE